MSSRHWQSIRTIFGDPDLALPPVDDREASRLYALGIERIHTEDLKGATEALAQADELGHPGAPRQIGELLAAEGDLSLARPFYERAYERGDGHAATQLGQLAKHNGNVDEALPYFEFADRAGDCEGAKSLGVLLAARGELDAAEAALRRADDRGSASASHSLGIFYEESRNDPAEADRAYRRAIDRGSPRSAVRLIELLTSRGQEAEIETLRARAFELIDEHSTVFKDLAQPAGRDLVRIVGLRQVAATSGGGCLLLTAVVALAALALGTSTRARI